MKKLTSLIFAIVLCITLAGCTETPAGSSNPSELEIMQSQLATAQQRLEEKQDEIDALTSDIEQKQSRIDELAEKQSELQEFKDTYSDYIDATFLNTWHAGGEYDDRTADLPEYEEGSIRLAGKQATGMGIAIGFDRKYRYCYYESGLPLEHALRVVRGYTGNDIYNAPLYGTVKPTGELVYMSEEYRFFGEPVMHYYTWFILTYRVSKAEMTQMVEILSDTDHEVYDKWPNKKFTDFDLNYERYELPNVDILYTFDADIINEYYRYA